MRRKGGRGDGGGDPESTVAVRPKPSRPSLSTSVGRLVRAIRDDDDAAIEAVLRLSRSRRVFAPLAFAVGAFAMVFNGLRLLLTNWRLTLVQALPAMWIWLATYDLKAHVLHGKSFKDRKTTRLNSSHT